MDSIPASRLLGIESPLRSGMRIRRVSRGAGLAQWMEFHSPFSEASLKGLGGPGMAAEWEYPEGSISQKKPTPRLNPAVCLVGKTPLGRWEWRQVRARTGKIQKNSTVSQKIPGFVPIPGKKDNISTFPSVSPLFWDGGGPENPMEPPPEFVQEKQAPGNSSSQNPPPKILGNDPELLFASRNPSQ